jgi:hypothetical protein
MPAANQPLVYVSYAWRSRSPDGQAAQMSPSDDREAIVDELCGVLDQEDQIVVGRDKKLVKTGDSIVDFAGDIARGGLILAVISHKSLRSDWCMVHELLQAFRRRNFSAQEFGSDVLALVLEDAQDDFNNPLPLVQYWTERFEQKKAVMELADPDRKGSPESWQDVDQIAELRSKLPDLIRTLRIRVMPRGAEAMREQGFRAIRELVLKRLEEKTRHLKRVLLSKAINQSLRRRHVFISYAHEDREWVDRLKRMLQPALPSGQELRLWDDSRIQPGMNWREESATALAEVKVMLLMVSAAFLASEFVMNEEVPKLLAAAEAEGLRVLWVSLSPCLVEQTLIGEYQGVLPPGESLAEMTKFKQERALKMLSERILEALQVPAHEREQEPEDSALSAQLVVEHNETNSSEQIIRWRARCRIWKEPLAEACDVPMAWIPPDAAQRVSEFLLGIEPVTLRQWQVVAGWPQQERTLNPDPTEHGAPDQPVTGINQEQALEFCRRLAVRSCRYYELPSEEQWEHACRAGSTSPYSWGDGWSVNLASAFANPWGLRRMHGSVWQWCRGDALRGGSWNEPFERRQASSRATAKDPLHPSTVGLRVCCLPFGTPYFQLEASRRQWRPPITRAACAQVLGRPLNEGEFSQLEQALQGFRILGILQLRLFLSLLADRLGDGADDPEQPLALESDPDRIIPLPSSVANDIFTLAAFAWQERDWRRLADQAKAPREVLADLGLASGKRQQAFLQALDRAVAAFPEPL